MLSKIDSLHDRIITTCQVEMEFKKNRQRVIIDSVSVLKAPEFTLSTPAFLSEAATVKVMKDRVQDVRRRVEKLKSRILSTMENPKTHDRIYKTIHRIFNNPSDLNLRHDSPEYKSVWRKALRRFLEGRPPRKKEDTSAGDSINWEWIVRCIEKTNLDVIIVSRDADYGLTFDTKGYANNWLTEEVKARVNQQRKLILVDRLSAALRLLDVQVTREEITSESETIRNTFSPQEHEIEALVAEAMHDLMNGEQMSSLIAETNTSGWKCDGYDINDVNFDEGTISAAVAFSFSGDQDPDKSWHGDTISGNCIIEIDREKNVRFRDFEADIERDYDDTDYDLGPLG